MLEAYPPAKLSPLPSAPPIADCVRLSVPRVAPPIASFTPPLLIRLTDPPKPPGTWMLLEPPLPPIAVPDTVTVPQVPEMPLPDPGRRSIGWQSRHYQAAYY